MCTERHGKTMLRDTYFKPLLGDAGWRPLGRIGAMPGWALTAESCPSMVAYFLLGRSCHCMRLPREPLPSAVPECGDLSGHGIWHFSIVDEPKKTLAFWRAPNDQVCGSLESGAPLLGFCRDGCAVQVRNCMARRCTSTLGSAATLRVNAFAADCKSQSSNSSLTLNCLVLFQSRSNDDTGSVP